jgi:hypothetical protein
VYLIFLSFFFFYYKMGDVNVGDDLLHPPEIAVQQPEGNVAVMAHLAQITAELNDLRAAQLAHEAMAAAVGQQQVQPQIRCRLSKPLTEQQHYRGARTTQS